MYIYFVSQFHSAEYNTVFTVVFLSLPDNGDCLSGSVLKKSRIILKVNTVNKLLVMSPMNVINICLHKTWVIFKYRQTANLYWYMKKHCALSCKRDFCGCAKNEGFDQQSYLGLRFSQAHFTV